MRKLSSFITNFLLYFGNIVFLAAVVFTIVIDPDDHKFIFDFLPLLVACAGVPIFILCLYFTKRAYHLFTGMFLIFWGIFLFCVNRNYFSFKVDQWWPILGVSTGIFISVAGLYRYRKLKGGYFIPALSLFLLGCWFMLFSFKIIKVPFRTVAIVGGPLFMIMACIFIIAFFFLQKRYKNLVLPDEESSEFDDDELIEINRIDIKHFGENQSGE